MNQVVLMPSRGTASADEDSLPPGKRDRAKYRRGSPRRRKSRASLRPHRHRPRTRTGSPSPSPISPSVIDRILLIDQPRLPPHRLSVWGNLVVCTKQMTPVASPFVTPASEHVLDQRGAS